MILESKLGMTSWRGISQEMPPASRRSARVRGGRGFNLSGLGALGVYAVDKNGNTIYDESGAPVEASDYAGIGDLITKGLAILNSQQVFQLNLDRLQRGLAPIPTQYAAPTLNVGMAGVSTPMLLLGAALLLYFVARK
jgi:hypothetical protein